MDTPGMCPFCSKLSKLYLIPTVFIISILLTFIDGQQVLNCTGVTSPDGTCFTLYRGPVTWSEARSACSTMNGFLASIATSEQQVVVRELMTGEGVRQAWLGASHNNGLWKWTDDNSLLQPQGCYNDKDTDRDLPFEVTTIDTAAINPETCINSCDIRGYTYAANQGGVKCFCGNTFGRHGTNKECVIECPGWLTSSISRWCGGHLMNSVYRINGAYGNWGYHQPNNHKGNQNCGIVDNSLQTKMADEDCLKLTAYICEITSRTCPVSNIDYVRLGSRCFFFNEAKVTWDMARFDCQSRGGDLITIKSVDEFLRLRNVTTDILPKAGQIWIGLNKGAGWHWESGEEFVDPQWAVGYPVLPSTCAVIDADVEYRWVDVKCTEAMAYICQSAHWLPVLTQSTTTVKVTTTAPGEIPTTSVQTTAQSSTTVHSTQSTTQSTTQPTTPSTSQATITTTKSTPRSTDLSSTTPIQSTTTTTKLTPTPTSTPETPTTTVSQQQPETTTTRTGPQTTKVDPSLSTTTTGSGSETTTGSNVTTPTVAPVTPTAAGSTQNGGLSTLEIALIAAFSLLFLLLLILLIVCLVMHKKKKRKNTIYSYDARPKAPIPNSGEEIYIDYDNFSSTQNLHTTSR